MVRILGFPIAMARVQSPGGGSEIATSCMMQPKKKKKTKYENYTLRDQKEKEGFLLKMITPSGTLYIAQ